MTCSPGITRTPASATLSRTSRTGSRESETLQQQAQNNTLPQFSASPDLHDEFVAAVIETMDSSADLSAQILNNPELSQKLLGELVPLIYRELKAAG
jgi:type I restriction enzyme, R subunit